VKLESVENDVLAVLFAEQCEQRRDLFGRALVGTKDPLVEPGIAPAETR